jgi:hypothetical protein
MTNHDPTTAPAPPAITHLFERFGECWAIIYDLALAVWSAERRSSDGSLRFIVDQNPAVLADKLSAAEAGQ